MTELRPVREAARALEAFLSVRGVNVVRSEEVARAVLRARGGER